MLRLLRLCKSLDLGGGVRRGGFGEDRGRRMCRSGRRRNSEKRMGDRCCDVSFNLASGERLDLPCYANRLGHLERCFECFPVGWGDSVDSEPNPYENQSGIEVACLCCCDLVDFILVHIWAVCVDVYTKAGFLVLVGKSPGILSALMFKSTKETRSPHTVYIVPLPKDRTIHPDAFRKLKLHAQRIDGRKMVPLDHLQTRIAASVLPLPSRLFSNLLPH